MGQGLEEEYFAVEDGEVQKALGVVMGVASMQSQDLCIDLYDCKTDMKLNLQELSESDTGGVGSPGLIDNDGSERGKHMGAGLYVGGD